MPSRSMFKWLVCGAVLNVVLLAPLWLRFGELATGWIALEAWWGVAVLVLLPAWRWRPVLCWGLVVLVMLVVLVGLGDTAMHLALGRALNLYFDVPLLLSIYHLLVGSLGTLLAVAVCVVMLAMLVGLATLLARWLRRLPRVRLGTPIGMAAGVMLLASTLLMVGEMNDRRLVAIVRMPVLDTLVFQARQVLETHRERRAFIATLEASPKSVRVLEGLRDKDVILAFIESYGISAITDERYGKVLVPRLEELAQRLETAGLSVVSGTLASPTRGGQSWLAHATTLSGRWIDNQLWYRLMLDSDQATLIDDFRATGHTTVAVTPAITRPWPEGRAYGFDQIHAAADIDYAGPPLNWVTMPDQFTLHHFQQRIREPHEEPLFAQLVLISSHAPWVPILPLLEDWDTVGDGSIFARWVDAGEPPEVLWQDLERVREHFALSVDYAVNATLRWAEDFVDDQTLMIVVGDHQPALLITGDDASAGVPVHVISGDARLLKPFLARGFVAGTLPPTTTERPRMDLVRHWLHEDFGAPR
ncbi:sulfatase-like hydrolase/transferase [Litchfieldella rifensis]|uniref:Sulfatase-like hydrolase/transferase n=1 Tax=Litchfieldella rifensis TaxID=762643 RepID=A0ABV7LJS7_9GAMM